jgi:hypothetical protein
MKKAPTSQFLKIHFYTRKNVRKFSQHSSEENVIRSNQNSEQTILESLEDEEGSETDNCEENFAVFKDDYSISEVGAVNGFVLHFHLKLNI